MRHEKIMIEQFLDIIEIPRKRDDKNIISEQTVNII